MNAPVEIALIGCIGSILSAAFAAVAVYFGTVNSNRLQQQHELITAVDDRTKVIKAQVDGQLTEVVALKEAVSFSKGVDRERDKQETKDAVVAGIKEANGKQGG